MSSSGDTVVDENPIISVKAASSKTTERHALHFIFYRILIRIIFLFASGRAGGWVGVAGCHSKGNQL